MTNEDEILKRVTKSATRLEDLMLRLYGQGNDLGDIPTIKADIKEMNNSVGKHDKEIASLKDKVKRNWHWVLVSLAIASLSSGLLELLRRL